MILLYDKTFNDLVIEAEQALTENNFSTTPGSIAKLFLNIINKSQSEYYDTLRANHMNAFLSTATGLFVDEIAKIYNCKRNDNEDDDTYKYRISNQISLLATSNEIAIKLAALSVSGVSDILIEKYTYGIGSFSIYVISDEIVTNDTIIENVRDTVSKIAPYGTKFDILTPKLKYVTLKLKLIFSNATSDSKAQEIKISVRNNVKQYLTTKSIGDSIIVNELTRIIMGTSNEILNFVVSEFRINDGLVNFKDQYVRKNERYILSSKIDGLIVN